MDSMGPVSLLFLFVLTIVFVLKMGSFWRTSGQDLPPGPRPWPLIGNLHLLDLKRPYRTMSQLSKRYGPVFSLQLGFQKMVILTGYETVKEALVNQAEAFAERPVVPVFEKVTEGYGVLFSHGENWKVMRRFILTTLRDYGMGKRTIEDKIVEECHFLIQKFESFKGKPFESTVITNAAAANIIVSILLGKRYKYEDPTFVRLLNLITENIRLAGGPSVTLYNMFPALGFLSGSLKTILKNRDELHAFIQATFIEHLKELDENDQRSLIDAFLIRQQEHSTWFPLASEYGVCIDSCQLAIHFVFNAGSYIPQQSLIHGEVINAEREIGVGEVMEINEAVPNCLLIVALESEAEGGKSATQNYIQIPQGNAGLTAKSPLNGH